MKGERLLVVLALVMLAAGAYLLWLDRGEVDNLSARLDRVEVELAQARNSKPAARSSSRASTKKEADA